ncbi:MAG: hypothetical protein ACXWKC_17785 [Xanthobacteraceae bacterium]
MQLASDDAVVIARNIVPKAESRAVEVKVTSCERALKAPRTSGLSFPLSG